MSDDPGLSPAQLDARILEHAGRALPSQPLGKQQGAVTALCNALRCEGVVQRISIAVVTDKKARNKFRSGENLAARKKHKDVDDSRVVTNAITALLANFKGYTFTVEAILSDGAKFKKVFS